MNDVNYALRTLFKRPVFFASSVLVLALGIATVAVAFTLVEAVLLRPLAFSESQRVVKIWANGSGNFHAGLFAAEFNAIQSQCPAFDNVAADAITDAKVLGWAEPQELSGAKVTLGFFSLFGIPIVQGRPFVATDFQHGGNSVIILSRRAWAQQFGADPHIAGKTLSVESQPYTIVGVADSNSALADLSLDVDFWVPLPPKDVTSYGSVDVFAKLKNATSIKQAQTELSASEDRLTREDWRLGRRTLEAVSLKDTVVGDAQQLLLILLATAGFLLLISCANLAILGLIRNANRQEEILIRRSLGASPFRIFRMLMTEHLLVAAAACALGLLFAFWGLGSLIAFASSASAYIPRLAEVRMDPVVLLVTVGIALLASLLIGVFPAARSAGLDVVEPQTETRLSARRVGARRSLSTFVVCEIALSVLLLAGFGLFTASLVRLLSVNLGFDPRNVLTFWVSPNAPTAEQNDVFFEEAQRRIESLPGVKAAGVAENGFFSGSTKTHYYAGGLPPDPDSMPLIEFRLVTAHFLQAIGAPLVKGRYIGDRVSASGPPEVMVNEAFERTLARDMPFSSQRIYMLKQVHQVVGVIGNIRNLHSPSDAVSPTVYFPLLNLPKDIGNLSTGMIAVRTSIPPQGLVAAIRSQISAIDKTQPIFSISSAEAVFARILDPARFRALLIGIFAFLGYLIAILGVYGVTSYAVSQRNREICIRMALGATPEKIFKQFVFAGLRLALIGLCVGVAASLMLLKVIGSLLYQTAPRDPVVLGGVALLVCVTAFAASVIPAARARKIDPMIFLRYE